jgi:hypothetical protein
VEPSAAEVLWTPSRDPHEWRRLEVPKSTGSRSLWTPRRRDLVPDQRARGSRVQDRAPLRGGCAGPGGQLQDNRCAKLRVNCGHSHDRLSAAEEVGGSRPSSPTTIDRIYQGVSQFSRYSARSGTRQYDDSTTIQGRVRGCPQTARGRSGQDRGRGGEPGMANLTLAGRQGAVGVLLRGPAGRHGGSAGLWLPVLCSTGEGGHASAVLGRE